MAGETERRLGEDFRDFSSGLRSLPLVLSLSLSRIKEIPVVLDLRFLM